MANNTGAFSCLWLPSHVFFAWPLRGQLKSELLRRMVGVISSQQAYRALRRNRRRELSKLSMVRRALPRGESRTEEGLHQFFQETVRISDQEHQHSANTEQVSIAV
jgi:hypothetical protein